MDPYVALSRCPVESVGGWTERGLSFFSRIFFRECPVLLFLSLSLWKFARFWVWSILNIERLRMIYVAWPDGNSEQEMRAIFQLRCFFQVRLLLCNWAELRVKSYRPMWFLFASEYTVTICTIELIFVCSLFVRHYLYVHLLFLNFL